MIEDILTPYISPRFASEEKYRLWHIGVVNPLPGQIVLGLHIPDMKKIAAGLAASENRDRILRSLELAVADGRPLSHEEKTVWGLILDNMKVPLEERFERFLLAQLLQHYGVLPCLYNAFIPEHIRSYRGRVLPELGRKACDTFKL